MEYLILLALVIVILLPLIPVYNKIISGKKAKYAIICNIASFFAICVVVMVYAVATPALAAEAVTETAKEISVGMGLAYIGAALVTGMSCIGAGIAVASAASSAIGATSENPKMLAKSLIFVALGEGVALYGLLISLQILNAIG